METDLESTFSDIHPSRPARQNSKDTMGRMSPIAMPSVPHVPSPLCINFPKAPRTESPKMQISASPDSSAGSATNAINEPTFSNLGSHFFLPDAARQPCISSDSAASVVAELSDMATLTYDTQVEIKRTERVAVVRIEDLRAEFLHFADAIRRDLAAISSQPPRPRRQKTNGADASPRRHSPNSSEGPEHLTRAPEHQDFIGRSKSQKAKKILRKKTEEGDEDEEGAEAFKEVKAHSKEPATIFCDHADVIQNPDCNELNHVPENTLAERPSNPSSPRMRSNSRVTPAQSGSLDCPQWMDDPSSPLSPPRSSPSKRGLQTHRRSSQMEESEKSIQHLVSEFNRRSSQKDSLKAKLMRLISKPTFDYIVVTVILMNGIVVGTQTDYLAIREQEVPPLPFQVLEYFFCFVFTTELTIRLYAFGCKFFTTSQKGWNIFDLIVVLLQLVEITMSLIASGLGFSFTILRVLRLLRVIRLARALRLISELRTIVTSIAGSLKPLFWTGVLLFMVVYVLGVYITQVVLNKRLVLRQAALPIPWELELYWGSLIRSIFSLFESITGGVDWDDCARPLIDHVGPELGILFSAYISFTVFAMLNVVTGVFIEAVMKNASAEQEERTRNGLRRLFHLIGLKEGEGINAHQFEELLPRQEMKQFFKAIDVDISNAQNLFELLDADSSGSLDMEEILDGCLKIWAPCQSLDMQMMRRDLNVLVQSLQMHGVIAPDSEVESDVSTPLDLEPQCDCDAEEPVSARSVATLA